MRSRLSRRALLRGAAGTALALPWLEAMQPHAHAAASQAPKRIVVFLTANGVFPERWWPTPSGETPYPLDKPPAAYYLSGISGGCANSPSCATVAALDTRQFTMSPTLEPLTSHRDDLLILEGIDPSGPGGHAQWGSALTGRLEQPGGTSLDQVIAEQIAGSTKFKSLQLGVKNDQQGGAHGTASWYAAGKPAQAENNPQTVFERVFSEVGAPDQSAIERLRARRKSVLDGAAEQAAVLQKQLGRADALKLQNYFESIRDVEARLQNVATGVSCQRPLLSPPTGEEWWSDLNNFPAVLSAQLDLLAMSFACDLTRVATVEIGYASTRMTLPWLGIDQEYHEGLGHAVDADMAAQNNIAKVDHWHAMQVAGFIERLKAIPEGAGSVFDNTVILWVGELAKGNTHESRNMPCLLAGSAGGFFKTGRYIRFPRDGSAPLQPYPRGRWSNDLSLTLLHSMGLSATSFGDPSMFSGAIDALRA